MTKKFLTLATIFTLTFSSMTSVHAAESTTELTPEQQAVINSYESVTLSDVSKFATLSKTSKSASTLAKSTSTTWRGSLYRGSVLMWSRDNISWTTSGGKVTKSSAWQEAGYIFPNIARATGISKYASSSSSVTYRASKTIGAGVVTPWGDVSIYEQDFTDFLKGDSKGNLTTW